MSHDPLCNQHDVELKRPCPVCAMYAQARADERENAVARIAAAHRRRRIRSVGRAIAAVRGES